MGVDVGGGGAVACQFLKVFCILNKQWTLDGESVVIKKA